MRKRCWGSVASVACIAVLALGACSSDGSSATRPTATSKATTTTTVANPDAVQAALDEATAIMRALHTSRPNECTAGFERNITLPPEQQLPNVVTRAKCVYEHQQVQAVAFANPDDRTTYVVNWTRRVCNLANKGDRRLLGATYWVVTPRAVTLVPTPGLAHAIVSLYGGEFRQENCPPSG